MKVTEQNLQKNDHGMTESWNHGISESRTGWKQYTPLKLRFAVGIKREIIRERDYLGSELPWFIVSLLYHVGFYEWLPNTQLLIVVANIYF